MTSKQVHEPLGGTHINQAAKQAVELAPVTLKFNDILIDVNHNSTESEVVKAFNFELDRLSKEYEQSPAGIEAKQKRQVEIKRKQSDVIAHTNNLPVIIKSSNRRDLMDWLIAFTDVADDVDVNIDHGRLYKIFKKSGYVENDFVGVHESLFNEPYRMERYVVGQVMNCLKRNMPPHPITVKFCKQCLEMITAKQ